MNDPNEVGDRLIGRSRGELRRFTATQFGGRNEVS